LAVVGDRLIVSRRRLFGYGATATGVENGDDRGDARRGEATRAIEPVRDRCAFEPAVGIDGNGREIRSPRDADLFMGGRHTALATRDIRAPFQQIRGQPCGHNWRRVF
jgi:hypothetical protein